MEEKVWKKKNKVIRLINKKEIIIYGYDYITKYQYHTLKNVENIKVINKEYSNHNHNVYKFNTLEEEVIFVAEEISVCGNCVFVSAFKTDYK